MPNREWFKMLELAAQPDAVPWARRHTRDVLRQWGVSGPPADDTELAVAELVTNAVAATQGLAPDHPPRCLTLTLQCRPAAVVVAVSDANPSLPHPVGATAPDAEHGRGLLLVASVAKEWGARPTTPGKCVWCVIPTRVSAPPTRKSLHAAARP